MEEVFRIFDGGLDQPGNGLNEIRCKRRFILGYGFTWMILLLTSIRIVSSRFVS